MSTTIRVSEHTRDRFAGLARRTGRPMSELVEDAADALERRLFFDALTRRYAELSSDPAAWAEVEAERRAEEGAIADDLG